MTDLELDYMISEEALQEAEESFNKLLEDYHALREHTDQLETILRNHGISYPDFCGWYSTWEVLVCCPINLNKVVNIFAVRW